MKEDRLYIIATYDLHEVGGSQMYVSGYSEYLESKGFEVICLFAGNGYGKACIPMLSKYLKGGSDIFLFSPVQIEREIIDRVSYWLVSLMKKKPDDYKSIYIESHDDKYALWGEVLAERLKAIHICRPVNEFYDKYRQCYNKYISFWVWKYERNEAYCNISLFEGMDGNWKTRQVWSGEREPIEDIHNELTEAVLREDYNILYIGRGNKEYVSEMIFQMGIFAKNHQENRIQFIFVGDMSGKETEICRNLCIYPWVKVILTGALVPIPKSLFSKIDVVLANSQTAYFSAYEKRPVIVIDSKSKKALGCFGYDYIWENRDSVNEQSGDRVISIAEALDNTLVKKEYDNRKIKLEPKRDLAKIYKRGIDAFEKAELENERIYYEFPVIKKEIIDFKANSILKRTAEYNHYRKFDFEMLRKCRVAVFGAGKEGGWAIAWMTKNGLVPALVVDNDESLWGERYCGYIVSVPSTIKNDIDFVIIANIMHVKDIVNQIYKYGFGDEQYYTSEFIRNQSIINICFYER